MKTIVRLLMVGVLSVTTATALPAAPALADTPPICEDGIDDDLDGYADWPADPGCSSRTDPNERGHHVCDNGVDEDGDGLADAPLDRGCSGPTDGSERSGTACDDGVDNDGDTFVDFPLDLGCVSIEDPTETPDCAAQTAPGVYSCPTPGDVILDEVIPSATVPNGEQHRVEAYVYAYKFSVASTGTHTVPCLVFSSDVTGDVNPCVAAGGKEPELRLVLLNSRPHEPDPQLTGSTLRVRVCHATYRVKVLGFGAETLPGVVLC